MKLVNQDKKQLRMCDLKDGDVAVILENNVNSDYTGRIIQRIDSNRVVSIGMTNDFSWYRVNENTIPVRKLEPGELLEI